MPRSWQLGRQVASPRVAYPRIGPSVYRRALGSSRPRHFVAGTRGLSDAVPRPPGQLPLPLGPDHLLPAGQLVRRRDVTDRAACQRTCSLMLTNSASNRRRASSKLSGVLGSDALPTSPPVLNHRSSCRCSGVVRRRPHMGHPADADELLELPRTNCGPCLEMVHPAGLEGCSGPLHDRLDVPLGHALADLPVDEEPAVAVELPEVEERPRRC